MALLTCAKCGKQFYGTGCPDCDFPASGSIDGGARRHPLLGAVFLAAGGWAWFNFHTAGMPFARRWHLLVVAAIFLLAGVGLITNAKGRAAALMGGLLCAGLSSLGFFAAFGPGELEGGIWFIPAAWNQLLGRIVFGLGACLCAAMAFWGFYRTVKPGKKR